MPFSAGEGARARLPLRGLDIAWRLRVKTEDGTGPMMSLAGCPQKPIHTPVLQGQKVEACELQAVQAQVEAMLRVGADDTLGKLEVGTFKQHQCAVRAGTFVSWPLPSQALWQVESTHADIGAAFVAGVPQSPGVFRIRAYPLAGKRFSAGALYNVVLRPAPASTLASMLASGGQLEAVARGSVVEMGGLFKTPLPPLTKVSRDAAGKAFVEVVLGSEGVDATRSTSADVASDVYLDVAVHLSFVRKPPPPAAAA